MFASKLWMVLLGAGGAAIAYLVATAETEKTHYGVLQVCARPAGAALNGRPAGAAPPPLATHSAWPSISPVPTAG